VTRRPAAAGELPPDRSIPQKAERRDAPDEAHYGGRVAAEAMSRIGFSR